MMHVTSVLVFVHLFSGSLFLDQKQTFKPCVPKNDIIKPCTKKKTKFTNSFNSKGCPTPRLEHSPWAPFTGQMCQIRWFPEKKRWNYGLWGFTMLTPCSQTAISPVFFAPAKAALRLLHANHLPVQLSPGTAIRPNQLGAMTHLAVPMAIHFPPFRCPQSHQSRTWWVYRWFNPKKGTNESSTLKEIEGTVLHQASSGFNLNMFWKSRDAEIFM